MNILSVSLKCFSSTFTTLALLNLNGKDSKEELNIVKELDWVTSLVMEEQKRILEQL